MNQIVHKRLKGSNYINSKLERIIEDLLSEKISVLGQSSANL